MINRVFEQISLDTSELDQLEKVVEGRWGKESSTTELISKRLLFKGYPLEHLCKLQVSFTGPPLPYTAFPSDELSGINACAPPPVNNFHDLVKDKLRVC